MQSSHLFVAISLAAVTALSACETVPDPIPEPVIVEIPEPVQTCAPVSSLQRVVIPAETKIMYAITMIDNPPYEPIERKEKQTRIVKPAEILYVDSEGKQVIDICEDVETGPTGPGEGEIIPADGEG